MTETIRPISTIARDIAREWKAVNYAAVPYLRELRYFDTVTDTDRLTGFAVAPSIIRGFLGSSSSFRGDTAAALKNELRAHIGEKPVTPRKPSGATRPDHYDVLVLRENGEISAYRHRKSKASAVSLARHCVKYGRGAETVDAWRVVAVSKRNIRTTAVEKILCGGSVSASGVGDYDTSERVARGFDGKRGAFDGD